MTSQILPADYSTPSFPSLYIPINNRLRNDPQYLYYTFDAWRFTLYWTLIFYGGAHLSAASCAAIVQWRNWRLGSAILAIYMVMGGLEAFLAGSVVGVVLGLVYEAGSFKMSTWIPFVWGCINTLVLVLSSFSIQGGL